MDFRAISSQSGTGGGSVLSHRAFVILWLSEMLSLAGDCLLMAALLILAFNITGSAGAVGLLMLVRVVSVLFIGSLAEMFLKIAVTGRG